MGRELFNIAKNDSRICAVTAAMKYATGLQHFAKAFPDRFFDVGIAEQHALTFCCGLASQGMVPVFAVYSTFLQRCFDQILHDAAIERKHIILCVDRAGFVGEDGETHQGLFDVPLLLSVPGVTIYTPVDASSLRFALREAIQGDGICVIRYPRAFSCDLNTQCFNEMIYSGKKSDILLMSYGRICENIAGHDGADSLFLNQIKPLPQKAFEIMRGYEKILFFEECMKSGGVGEKIMGELYSRGFSGKFTITAVDEEFVPAAEAESQLRHWKLDRNSIKQMVENERKT